MTRREYRRRWLIQHRKYEKRAAIIFRKHFRSTAFRLPFDSINGDNYEILITLFVLQSEIENAYFDVYSEIGIRHGKRIGREINSEIREQKDFDPTTFEGSYRDFVRNWILNNAGTRITSVREELIESLIKFISDGIENGQDIRTISRQLRKHILSRGFYRWQIERIVRTETTAAANLAATRAGENSRVVWEKEWISSRDSRTRRRPDDAFDHFDIDGMRVGRNDKFNIQGDLLDYPGDPNGQPANVINCRCTVAIVPKRDENGRIVFRDRLQVIT
ncbi:MAG: phage minor head protein [Bacteroidota bacterium]